MLQKSLTAQWSVVYDEQKCCRVEIAGDLNKANIKKIYLHVKKLKQKTCATLSINCKNLTNLDFSGALLIVELISFFTKQKKAAWIEDLPQEYASLLLFARKNLQQKPLLPSRKGLYILQFLENIGNKFLTALSSFIFFLSFLGETLAQFLRVLLKPWSFRFKAMLVHIEKSGAQALPIVALTSFLVGLVIAYQGAEQLAKFGANIFIVDMVSISVFRELAPLIAAIVIAGRSSSAYTAEIGTMKITEEIDALRAMGFEPILFLVLPRVIALVISMPLIVFFADIVGVFGGMIVAKNHLGIGYSEFIQRTRDVVEMKHILIGLFKAPFFGLLIALIGCFRGFQVTGSTESIGRYTTISVVNAIFWVIACNALISVLLTEVGI